MPIIQEDISETENKDPPIYSCSGIGLTQILYVFAHSHRIYISPQYADEYKNF